MPTVGHLHYRLDGLFRSRSVGTPLRPYCIAYRRAYRLDGLFRSRSVAGGGATILTERGETSLGSYGRNSMVGIGGDGGETILTNLILERGETSPECFRISASAWSMMAWSLVPCSHQRRARI
jgi:hypothetical protein